MYDTSDLATAARLYAAAVADGAVPKGKPVGTGRRSALKVVEEQSGWGRSKVRALLDIVPVSGEKPRVRVQAGSSNDSPRQVAMRGDASNPYLPDAAVPPPGFVVTSNNGAYDADGTLLRQWVGSKPAPGEAYAVPAGHVVKGESALIDPDGRVLAKWVKTTAGVVTADFVEALQAAFAGYDGAAPLIAAPVEADDDLLTAYVLPDLHFGMVSWGAETGSSYDIKIATKLILGSIEKLVAQSQPSARAVILGLGDLLHGDNTSNVTPGSGHTLDVDGRHPKVLMAAAQLMIAIVDLVAAKHREIEVVILPGNHDPNSSVALRVGLGLFYSANDRITVNMDPGIAWFRLHGTMLIGATHGHTMPAPRIAMLMASDRPVEWGKSRYRVMLHGHFHSERVSEHGSVRVEGFASPAARDAWNAASGFRSGRSLSALTFHVEHGETGRHRVNIPNDGAAV